MLPLATRMSAIQPSPTLAIDNRAKKLKAEGGDIINFSAGEPDFDTPTYIKEAAIKAIHDGRTRYTAVTGILPLREAITVKFAEDNQLNYTPEQILVSTGAKQCLFNAIMALISKDDEVIIPAPYWVSYPDMVKLADGIPVIIPSSIEQHYKINALQLEEAITDKTKMVILNSPNNPSGMVYSREELASLAEVLMRHPNIIILTDDIYETILWSGQPFVNIVNACPALYDRTLVVNGMSKAFAMTGWRLGYVAGAKSLIDAMAIIQSQSTSNTCSISQYAGLAALTGSKQSIHDMVEAYYQRQRVVYDALSQIPGVRSIASQGTFYSLPDVSDYLKTHPSIDNDIALAELLLTQAGVALVPGSAFGAPGTLRISFATDMATINDGLNRIQTILKG